MRRCWQGLMMAGVFSLASGLVENTIALQDMNTAAEQTIAAKEAELVRLRETHQELLATKAFLESEAGILAHSRPLGYGRPGEVRVMLERGR